MPVPYAFGAATTAIPLSQLDDNFNTTITLGNTAIQLGNTVTTLNNMTLANVTISSGNVTITNVSVTTVNAATVNTTTLVATTANVTTINATDVNVAANVTLNAGTVNGVAYLNGSKVLTTGSALTFDGNKLAVQAGSATANRIDLFNDTGNATLRVGYDASNNLTITRNAGDANIYLNATQSGAAQIWQLAGSEQMRLTSTGLGIGTSSPDSKLHVVSGASSTLAQLRIGYNGTSVNYYDANTHYFRDGSGPTNRMVLDSSGNLGLGVTPSAWDSTYKAFQSTTSALASASGDVKLLQNAYYDGGWKYMATQAASMYSQASGAHNWRIAPSGTAGNAISFTQALTLDANRNLLLNGTSAGASSVGTFAIFNGTAPTGSVTDGIILYAEDVSSSSELKVRDEAGNVTTLSPHNFSLIPEGPSEDMAWAYYSEKGGKRINVDMLKLARMVEKLTGEKLVYES